MIRAFKFRLYPNVTQTRALDVMLETHRRLYNQCLAQRKTAWQQYEWGEREHGLSFKEQRSWYTACWREHPFYSRLNSNSADETIKRLDIAFQAFFRRLKAGEKPGYPRFKGRDRFDTIKFGTYPNGLKLAEGRARIQHVGAIKVKLHRAIQGTIKVASIKREADKWFVIFTCDLGECQVEPSTNPEVGIDMGLESFLTTDQGEHIANPRFLKGSLPELRRVQRALSRRKIGGKNRRKVRAKVARLYAKVRNERKEYHHHVSLDLVRRFGCIAAENLDIKGMMEERSHGVENRRLRRSISDVAWGGFLSTLRYKAESAGVVFVGVEPRGTSQQCSGCGATVPKTLKERTHRCPHCGLVLHRDVNAARNILARGRLARIGPAGLNQANGPAPRSSPVPPVIQAPSGLARQKHCPKPRSLKKDLQLRFWS